MGAGLLVRVHASFGPFGFLEGRYAVYVMWLVLTAAVLSAWVSRPRIEARLDWGLLPLAAAAAVAMVVIAELEPKYAVPLQAAALETAGGFALLVGMIRFLRAHAQRWVEPARQAPKARIRMADDAGLKAESMSADDLAPGDLVRLKAGAHIPVDGIIERGSGAIAEGVIHGARHAIHKGEGDLVYEGSTSGAPEIAIRWRPRAAGRCWPRWSVRPPAWPTG